MRTLSILILGASILAFAGCEKTIHEASRAMTPMTQRAPAIVPALDGVPIA